MPQGLAKSSREVSETLTGQPGGSINTVRALADSQPPVFFRRRPIFPSDEGLKLPVVGPADRDALFTYQRDTGWGSHGCAFFAQQCNVHDRSHRCPSKLEDIRSL